MPDRISRRAFVVTSTAGLAAAAAGPGFAQGLSTRAGQGPAMMTKTRAKPAVIASGNGHVFKNGGDKTCIETAFALMMQGRDVLDALIAGVTIVELDPLETSVGYGGLPNADGVVQLDACCMHGPKKRAGGVGALEGVKTPAQVAQKVMDHTDHHLIVGKGAQEFARTMGFEILSDLNTERSRATWLKWKQETDKLHYLDPIKREAALRQVDLDMMAQGWIDPNHFYGTINCNGVNAAGEVCGVTTTSGMAWKIPGRLGDSPVLGAGLYVDGDVGAAGSTGRGEANLFNLTSFLIVDAMRRGMHPKDAGLEGLKRIRANTVEKRLRKANGDPNFNINFYMLNVRGEYAAVSLYDEKSNVNYAVCTEEGARVLPCEPLLAGTATE